jgi:hypothetical protein
MALQEFGDASAFLIESQQEVLGAGSLASHRWSSRHEHRGIRYRDEIVFREPLCSRLDLISIPNSPAPFRFSLPDVIMLKPLGVFLSQKNGLLRAFGEAVGHGGLLCGLRGAF